MDIPGAMGLFKKLDVGPLELGDYLGWTYFDHFYSLIRLWIANLLMLVLFYPYVQQLVLFSLQQILFAPYRFLVEQYAIFIL
jgi:hypothetical protein